MRHRGWFTALTALALAATLAFLVLPIVAMFLEVGIAEILRSLGGSGAREALALSIRTTVIAMVVILVVGTPTAYLLGTRSFRGHSVPVKPAPSSE